MKSVWTSLTEGIHGLSLPAALQIQLFAVDFPQLGKVLAAISTWIDGDHEDGRKWIDKIASLGNCIVNMTDAKTVAKYGEDTEKLVHCGVHSLRSPKPNEESVFGARQDHHMIEIVSMTADPSLEGEASEWGHTLVQEIKEQDRENILEGAYISLLGEEDADLNTTNVSKRL